MNTNNDSILDSDLDQQQLECQALCEDAFSRSRRTLELDLSSGLRMQRVLCPKAALKRTDDDVLHVAVNTNAARSHISNVQFHQYRNDYLTRIVDGRFVCVDPLDIWLHYSPLLPLPDLVALGDTLTCRNTSLRKTTLEDMRKAVNSRGRFTGKPQCRRALSLIREGTDSPQETATRLALMRYGLDCPVVNPRIIIEASVQYLDMAYLPAQVAVEYDGEHHRLQWKEDLKRRERLEALGWRFITVFKEDLASPMHEERLAQQVAYAIESQTGMPVPLIPRLTDAQLADGRRHRRISPWNRPF